MPRAAGASPAEAARQSAASDELRYVPVGHSFASVTDQISELVLGRATRMGWFVTFAAGSFLLLMFSGVVVYLLAKGVGIWGINIPVGWCFAITSFVWWIGIGHAGTLISAILVLLHQKWRTSINRIAEAMTIFAVMCAGTFPLLHLGRPWYFYWLLPYPNTMQLWPQFRSALVWDVFAVSTYFTVSLMFWYMGMIPDFATLRDRATKSAGRWRTACWRWAGAIRPDTGTAIRWPTCSWPDWRRRSSSRCTRLSARTLPFRWSPAGTRRSFLPTSWQAPCSPASPW